MGKAVVDWRPNVARAEGPIYLAVADAMAADIDGGRLRGGDRLPTHRALAEALGVNLTTITRAYAEAERRGLTEAGIGRGTFVRRHAGDAVARAIDAGLHLDMSMNLPPLPEEAGLRRHMVEGMAALQKRQDFAALLNYGPSAGHPEDRAAAATWLSSRFGTTLPADRVLVCGGAQSALLALATTFVPTGGTVLTEALTYPGFRALASHLGLRLSGVAMDGEGLLPDALDEACRREKPQALYCMPTMHNPTTATMSPKRRKAIAAVVRKHALRVFEDDAYSTLLSDPLPPLASLVPEHVFHVATLAKVIAPGMRTAFLAVPEGEGARVAAAIRATTLTSPPLMSALATQWIGDGTADRITRAIAAESAARQKIAASILPKDSFAAHPQGPHLWLRLPSSWTRAEFDAHLRQLGLAIVSSDAFAVAPAPEAVRIALGAAKDRDRLQRALRLVAEALGRPGAASATVV